MQKHPKLVAQLKICVVYEVGPMSGRMPWLLRFKMINVDFNNKSFPARTIKFED